MSTLPDLTVGRISTPPSAPQEIERAVLQIKIPAIDDHLVPSEIFAKQVSPTVLHSECRSNSSPAKTNLEKPELPKVPKKHLKQIAAYLFGEIGISDIRISKENYKSFLKSVKILDLALRQMRIQLDQNRSSYALRTLCIIASEGELSTFEAYTKSIDAKHYENLFSPISEEYASKAENYVPERVRLHSTALQNYVISSLQLSRRLGAPFPTVYALRGNSGVGKSRAATQDQDFRKGLDENGDAVGALNPDTVKNMLRTHAVTNKQVHIEGASLNRKIAKELFAKARNNSFIIDERLSTLENVKPLIELTEKRKGVIVFKDIDAPLMVSCFRVLGRDINKDPCLPFEPISWGFKAIREQRKALLQLLVNHSNVQRYDLYVTSKDNQSGLACQKNGVDFKVLNRSLMAEALNANVETEIQQTAKTVITRDLIAQLSPFGIKAEKLSEYIGYTIEDALKIHASKLPD